ncbi:MAG: universal stress protein [Bdellovibrionaceae bacterium]|nr:universal stress protein [Pseudobdellovibrionaceae bacterium]
MRALWAFEPFHQNQQSVKGMHDLLLQLTGRPAHVEYGFIATRAQAELNLAFHVEAKDRFSTYPRQLIFDALRKAKVSARPQQVHVRGRDTFSTTEAVDAFLKLARQRKVDCVALFTHGRKGYSRLALGSFAETAIHRSAKNLLIAGPKTRFSKNVKSAFLFSDFGPKAKKQVREALMLARGLQARLTVFHAAQVIYKWSLDESDPEVLAYRKKTDRMKNWILSEAERVGVACDVRVTSAFNSASELGLAEAAKAKADLLIVTSKVGPLEALVGGSVTRHIIRTANRPVLVLKSR